MAPESDSKKTEQVLVRLPGELALRFNEALAASDMTSQNALRGAAQAMVVAYLKFGKIPKDMEIRQAQIGDMKDAQELLERAHVLFEAQTAYNTAKTQPSALTRHREKHGGRGGKAKSGS